MNIRTNIQPNVPWAVLFATVFATSVYGVSVPAEAASVQHVAHRGFYQVTLGKSDPSSSIRSVDGRMVAEWAHSCDGWTANQRLAVTMQRHNGRDIESEVNATSFESTDGTNFQFSSKSTISGEVAEEVRGKAERPGRGQPGVATYSVPADLKIELPPDTLFPFEHSLFLIEAGEKGTTIASRPYFDGSQPELSPMTMSMLMLGGVRAADKGPGADLGAITDHRWWSVRLALFANATAEAEPEFEMTQDLQDNGVVRRFVFDYGDFTMVASLVRIEELELARCK